MITLILLVLATILIIGLLFAVGNQRKTASSASNEAASHQLADTVAQIVIGQIQNATISGATTNAWASQPGMIRTYDNSGNEQMNYKLYSSDKMTTTGALTVSGAPASGNNYVNDYDANWASIPGVYTDLNSPVTDESGYANFPILDGNNMAALSADIQTNSVPSYYSYTNSANLPQVAGFGINSSQLPGTYNPSNPLSPTNTPVPMPVKWLYELQNGTLIAPDLPSSATSTVTFTHTPTANQPSASNPIIGRIAFWTDDETSKVNINTACGDVWSPASVTTAPPNTGTPPTGYNPPGAFWDIPRAASSYDFNSLAYAQPAQNEFQRYPGHPATVYLSAVLPIQNRDQIFSIVPRVNGGGSEGGTALPTSPVTPDSDRLYASVDELLYAPTENNAPPLRDLNDPGTSPAILNKQTLERSKFFLTANSRAPEVNLFGMPRVAIWPIDQDVVANPATSPRGTAFDKLIASCSHLGAPGVNPNSGVSQDYFFQRSANGYMSQTQDYNISRNPVIYSYLQTLMGKAIPGYGGSLNAKFTTGAQSDANQILTEIFDYIRCTNPSDDNIAFGANYVPPTNGNYTSPQYDQYCYTPNGNYESDILTGGYNYDGNATLLVPKQFHAFIAPALITSQGQTTQGFGRTATVSELGLHFICCGDGGIVHVQGMQPPWNTPGDGGLTATVSGTTYYSDFPPLTTPLPNAAQIAANPFLANASGYMATTSPGYNSANWNYNLPTYNWQQDTNGTNWTGLQPGQRRVKAIFLMNPYSVSPGYTTMGMSLGLEVTGLNNLAITGYYSGSGNYANTTSINMGFPPDGTVVINNYTLRTPIFGVNYPFFANAYLAPARTLPENATIPSPQTGDLTVPTNKQYNFYPLVSAPITVSSVSTTSNFTLSGGSNIQVKVWHLSASDTGNSTTLAAPQSLTPPSASSTLIQTINVNFSALTSGINWPVPTLVTNAGESNIKNPVAEWDFSNSGVFGNVSTQGSVPGRFADCGYPNAAQYIEGFIDGEDVVKTMVPGYPTDTSGIGGDYRLLAAQNTVSSSTGGFVAHRFVSTDATLNPSPSFAHSLIALYTNGWILTGLPGTDFDYLLGTSQGLDAPFAALITSTPPQNAYRGNSLKLTVYNTGDFDNGNGSDMDGPYINKPDDGYAYLPDKANNVFPYFGYPAESALPTFFSPNRQVSSPGMFGSLPVGVIRQLPWETLLFRPQPTHPDGVPVPDTTTTSISGGVAPYGSAHTEGKTGNGLPADHLIMDLFWMPVVEPYAISESFSTAGKINLNYQIAPFTYITRATAVDALLKSQRLIAIPSSIGAGSAIAQNWKAPFGYGATTGSGYATDYRSDINLTGCIGSLTTSSSTQDIGTLRQFDEKFAAGDLFRSASQICDIYLTPVGQSWTKNASATTFWNANRFTGDNSRERPYANLYGCLTTKSNTYTVHFRVQTLQQVPGAPANEWIEGQDVITSEYRGSTLIERYLDTDDTTIPDFASTVSSATTTLDSYYKFRVLSTRKFNP